MNIQSNIYNGMYNLKILCARQSACELNNPAPLHWVESWLDAIQWLDSSLLCIILVDLAYRFPHDYGHSCWGSQNAITTSGSRLYTSRKISYSVNFYRTLIENGVFHFS